MKKRLPAEGRGPDAGHKKATIDAREAALHLRLIQHGQHIVEMYRKFFTEEFARDGVDYSSADRLLDSYDDFARLVDDRFFPVHLFSSNDLLWEEPDMGLITMHLCFHHFAPFLWFEHESDLSRVERLIVSAAGHGSLEMRSPEGRRFSPEKLRQVCWRQKGIISRLWLAAMALLGDTGNVWLDLDEDTFYQSEPPEWTEGQVTWLAKEFKEARRMSDDIEEFFAWVGDDQERLEYVKRLLRRAQVPDEPVRVKTRSGRPLAETLTVNL